MQVALDAGQPEPIAAHRLKMSTAGDEGDLFSGGGQAGAEVAADPAAAHDGEFHAAPLWLGPCRWVILSLVAAVFEDSGLLAWCIPSALGAPFV